MSKAAPCFLLLQRAIYLCTKRSLQKQEVWFNIFWKFMVHFSARKIQYWNLIYLFDSRQIRRFSQTPTIFIWPVVHSRDTKDVNKLDKRYKTLLEYLVFSFRLWGILCLKSKISRYNKKYNLFLLLLFFSTSSTSYQS